MLSTPVQISLLLMSLVMLGCQGGRSSEAPSSPSTPTPPPSLGSVQLDEADDLLTLSASAGRVLVHKNPLRLEFQTPTGHTVLQSTASPALPFSARPASVQRLPAGLDSPDIPPLYAPFSFLVGTALSQTYPASFWVGNMLASASLGVEYRLDAVQSVEPLPDGVLLHVSTTDPSGRGATLSVTADTPGTFKLSLRLDSVNEDVPLMAAAFASPAGEGFHGFGGRRDRINQRGQDFINWAEEFHQTPEAVANQPGNPLFEENFQFPTGPQGAYYVQSLFISSEDYGFLLERDELSHWRMASDRDDAWMVEVAGSVLDFVVAPGSAPKAIQSLTAITGRHRMPPEWALGPILSEAIQSSENNLQGYPNYLAKVEESIAMIRDMELPVEAFIFEGWTGLQQIGAYQQVVDALNGLGVRPMTYYRAFLGQSDDGLERPTAFEEALAGDYMVKNVLGLPYIYGSPLLTTGLSGLIDFTNPEAVRWWKEQIKQGLAEGSHGFMQDFGEQTFPDMVFHDGSTGIEMHNRYAVLYHQATREAFDEYLAENPGSDLEPFFFVRNGYTGGPNNRRGSAHYESASWPGDNTADWSRNSGIGSVIPDMLNRAIGGSYGFVTEIGGYIDTLGRPPKELVIRWSHHASLMPVYRLHGGPVNGTHMPWRYDQETVEEWRRGAIRHIAAQPLIMQLWQEAFETGMPITRPLWLAYPDDAEAALQDQQFLLGPDVLVAPVFEPGVDSREVYFPTGCWQHPEQGDRYEGPAYAEVAAPLGVLPYYFRCGTQPFVVPAELLSH
ncbi:MAG: TIM-barrel domain-containing protein [Oceanococcaceae bacterium]